MTERRDLARPGSQFTSRTRRRLLILAVVALAAALSWPSCRQTPPAESIVAQAASATAAPVPAAGPTAAHGDHNPHNGGIVMMKGDDLHYEVVLDQTGKAHRVYFTDAVREDLPASIASDVVLTVRRPGASDERIVMQIDDAGESWVGSGQPVTAPASTNVRLAFVVRHEPYWIDLPFTTGK